jgi:hypothetical protein
MFNRQPGRIRPIVLEVAEEIGKGDEENHVPFVAVDPAPCGTNRET